MQVKTAPEDFIPGSLQSSKLSEPSKAGARDTVDGPRIRHASYAVPSPIPNHSGLSTVCVMLMRIRSEHPSGRDGWAQSGGVRKRGNWKRAFQRGQHIPRPLAGEA